MPSTPYPSCHPDPGPSLRRIRRLAAAPPARELLPQAREIANATRGRILGLSGLALRAQANSLPNLASLLLAGSRERQD